MKTAGRQQHHACWEHILALARQALLYVCHWFLEQADSEYAGNLGLWGKGEIYHEGLLECGLEPST